MNHSEPGSWLDRIVGWCFTALFGALVLYAAVTVFVAILPVLVAVVGGIALLASVIGAVVVYRTGKNGW